MLGIASRRTGTFTRPIRGTTVPAWAVSMPNPSSRSRLILALSLTVTVVIMLVVAFSRPPASREPSELLSARSSPLSGPAAAHDAPDSNPLGETPPTQLVEASGDRESTDPAQAARGEQASSDVPASADLPHAPATATPDESTPVAPAENTEPAPAFMPDQPPGGAEGSQAGSLSAPPPDVMAPAPTQPQEHTPPAQTLDKPVDSPGQENAAEPASGDSEDSRRRLDPRERLSREFARRAAARDRGPAKPIPAAPPAHEIFPPAVSMSHAHRESCLVFVGDAMPDATLPDGQGQPHRIEESCGEQLTAILFWSQRHPYALDQYRELQHDLVPFHPLGVATLAIHVGEPGDSYGALCEEYGRDVLCLLDRAGEYFRQVSTGTVPRIYLLDAERKVIWLDIEYSRTTRYELRNALNYALRDARSPTNASDP